jgi:N6-adenosine-specific RNA methylase IME4
LSRYATILADPPWDVKAGPAGAPYTLDEDGVQRWDTVSRPSRSLSYQSMTVAQIAALRVADVAADDAHLYLWTINKYLRDAFDIAKAWGFEYSTTLVWAKKPMGGGLGGAYGISTEFLLFCRRGSLAAHGRQSTTWFDFKRPYDLRGKPNHSGKAQEFYGVIEQVSPGPYLEMFARSNRLGWDSWGDECLSVDLPLEAA